MCKFQLLKQLEKQARDIYLDLSINNETKENKINELWDKLLNSLNK